MRFIQNVNTYFAIFSDFFYKGKVRMSIKERVKDLCKENGISLNKLEQEIGVASGYLSKLDNPGIKIVIHLAEYFGVDVGYLLSDGENSPIIETATKEAQLTKMSSRIKGYALKLSEMPEEKQKIVCEMIDALIKKEE